jgi:hypothetical protein
VTVSALLDYAKTNVCADANKALSALTDLDLQARQLTKLDALANFTQLQFLHLQDNDIHSLAPIAALPALQRIDMGGNEFLGKMSNRITSGTGMNCPIDDGTNAAVRTYCRRDPAIGGSDEGGGSGGGPAEGSGTGTGTDTNGGGSEATGNGGT